MGAPVYDIGKEYNTDSPLSDDVSTSPAWVVAVVPLALPLSFSRQNMKSVSQMAGDGAQTRPPGVFVITSDCISLRVSGSKDSHTKQLQAVLKPGDVNYLVNILPGDWIFAWMLNNEDSARDLVKRILQGKACNAFLDGLKFVGRAWSVRKHVAVDRGAGTKTATYSLAAYAFKEMDTSVFYDPNLAEFAKENQQLTWLAKIGFDIRELFKRSPTGAVADNAHVLIPAFIELLLGRGLPSTVNPGGTGTLQAATGALAPAADNDPKEAPFAYLVPKEVGQLLGKKSRSKKGGVLAYADILTVLFGVQDYSNSASATDALGFHNDFTPFLPFINKGAAETTAQHRYTGTPLLGAFTPLFPDFTNKPLWAVLSQFLNPAVNEMYTTLRVDEDGTVQPTFVLRQIPFTTDAFTRSAVTGASSILGLATQAATDLERGSIPHTTFLSLPRWRLPSATVFSVDIGRSDATRTNFVHVYGQNGYTAKQVPIVSQLVRNPPIRDDLDIQRSGLHTYMTTVACEVVNQVGKVPSAWMQLVADRLIGSQFTLNGTIEALGISAPIAEGDNLEWDGVVYHIEGLEHACSVSASGQKSFTTTLSLSNGMRADPPKDASSPTGSPGSAQNNPDAIYYPGIKPEDNTKYDPGLSVDGDPTLDQNKDAAQDAHALNTDQQVKQ